VKLDLSTCTCPKPRPRGPLPEMLQVGDFRGVCASCGMVIEPALVYPQDPARVTVKLPPCELCGREPASTSLRGRSICRTCLYIEAD
jgi:hypothetical protein